MVEMNPCLICTKFLSVSAAKVADGHKVFCCHPLLRARFSGNIWQEELAARFKKQGVQDSFMLGCGGWEVGMGMSSMVGIGQGWDVLREPGLGKVYAPI